MELTSNYNLKKPELQDAVNIDDLNENADIIDSTMQSIETLGQNTKGRLEDHLNDKNNPHEVRKVDIIAQERRTVIGIATSGQEVNFEETHNVKFDSPPDILVVPLNLPSYERSKPNDSQVPRAEARNVTAESFIPQVELIVPNTAQYHALSPKPHMYAEGESWTSPITNPNTTRVAVDCMIRLAMTLPPNMRSVAYMQIKIYAKEASQTEWTLHKDNTVSATFGASIFDWGVNHRSSVFGHRQVLELPSGRYEFKVELARLWSVGKWGLDTGSGRSWLRVDSWQESSELVLSTGQAQYMATGPVTVE